MKPENIPAELKARAQWVVWRLVDKKNGKKPSKKPYTADAKAPATSCDYTDPANWRSFDEALAFYQSRSGYLSGIGYVFSADDPYVGGDVDDDLSTDRLPPTYAEISPSGKGIKFIARANGDYGRKTTRGELYSSKRFFTITGNVLAGHEQIAECQEEVEAFHASLGGNTQKSSSGKMGNANGSRAQLAADIPETDWEAARHLLRTEGDNLIRRVKAAGREGTQLGLLLAHNYREFHKKWSFVGLYRNDGTLDHSQVRAVAAQGIKGRGFTFPEYVVIMSRLYAADALAKWGTKEAWRAELAALWNWAADPRHAWTPRAKKVKRGRAGNHADLVEKVYQLIIDHRAGDTAIIKTGEIAGVIGCHRRTIITILDELEQAGRIGTRKQFGRSSGIIIQGVIYSDQSAAVSPQPTAPNEAPPVSPEETLELAKRVSSECAAADHTLHDAIRAALDALPGKRLNERTGELKAWPRTAKRICAWVAEHYPQLWPRWERNAPYAIASIRRQQRNARFAELHDLSAKDLEKRLNVVSRTIGSFDRRAADPATDPRTVAYYTTEANKRRGQLAMLAAERADRDAREERRLARLCER